jgi:hypothetical protein
LHFRLFDEESEPTMKNAIILSVAVVLTLLSANTGVAQPQGFNYDEAKVPPYTLPDALVLENGQRVADPATWTSKRRGEILHLFGEYVYGHTPTKPVDLSFDVFESSDDALGGTAIRKQVTVHFSDNPDGPQMDILIYLPKDAKGPVPIFVGLNFSGNHAINSDPAIRLSTRWMRKRDGMGLVDGKATEKSRGVSASRWPVEMINKRGYGVATIYCGDIDPDFDDGFQNGVHPLFYTDGASKPAANGWGTIGAWAWGLSRAVDYFETDDMIDHERVAVIGHSRLGKTSLWAGAQDERFAFVISNDSGCGGAALSRRRFGETVKRINTSFPHWFCDNFNKFNDKEDDLPVDQHMLIALMAPRPVYIASANDDTWADPRGEFLSALHADPVYKLLGLEGLPTKEMPEVDQPVQGTIGYHKRSGGHDVKKFDWEQYLNFADKHLGK